MYIELFWKCNFISKFYIQILLETILQFFDIFRMHSFVLLCCVAQKKMQISNDNILRVIKCLAVTGIL